MRPDRDEMASPPPGARPWTLELESSRGGALVAVAGAWLLGLGAFALVHYASGGTDVVAHLVVSLAFPAVISYYGLKTAFLGAGRLQLRDDGFSVSRGFSEERHAWRDVAEFFVDRFGTSIAHEGRPVPHFRLQTGEVRWLPDNLGPEAARLVAAMERLRTGAAAGAMLRPASVAAFIGEPDEKPESAPHSDNERPSGSEK